MSKVRWIVLMLVLVGCSPFDEAATVNLASEFSFARKSYIVASPEPVGRPGFRSYLGSGLRPDVEGDWAYGEAGERSQAFGFFLYEKRPVTLAVSGWLPKGAPRTVVFSIGSRILGQGVFSSQAQLMELEVPVEVLDQGMNWVSVEGGKGMVWRDFIVRPGKGAISQKNRRRVPAESNGQDELSLPFGEVVDFALESSNRARLTLRCDGWTEPGAAELSPSDLRLVVEARTETESAPVHSQTLRGPGPHRVDLPDGLGRFALRLRTETTGGQAPLPGQLGVKLLQPVLLRDQAVTEPGMAPSTESSTEPVESSSSRPNIVLYIVDTLRADRLSLYGYPHPTSPKLSDLAKDGVVFSKVTGQSSWTKPTVASILTGLEPSQHGVLDFNDILERQHTSWPEHLQPLGYQSFAVVANPLVGQRYGFDQGFDKFESLSVTNTAEKLNSWAEKFLEEREPGRPFFLFLQPIDPHLPYHPPQPWRERALEWNGLPAVETLPLLPNTQPAGFAHLTHHLQRQSASGRPPEVSDKVRQTVSALYDGEVASTDAALGQLIDILKQQGLYQNTLIVVTSDHGEEVLDRDWLGHMHSFHEELIHVPLVIKFPNSKYAGTQARELWQQIDILPTVLEAVGDRPKVTLDGLSFPGQRSSVAGRSAMSEVLAGGDAREANQGPDFLESGHVLRSGDFKLIHHDSSMKRNPPRALYDLSTDPKERRNLIFDSTIRTLFLERELLRRSLRKPAPSATKATGEPSEAILRSLQYLR